MGKITRESDGSYRWDCSIDTDYHRKTGRQGLWAVLFICAFVVFLCLMIEHSSGTQIDFVIPLIVIGVILAVSLPLLYLWNHAPDPHERYVMTENEVKSGYGKGAVWSEFGKTKEVVITSRYIEMIGKYRNNRIYVPPEDMDFVRDFILKRIPEDAAVKYM